MMWTSFPLQVFEAYYYLRTANTEPSKVIIKIVTIVLMSLLELFTHLQIYSQTTILHYFVFSELQDFYYKIPEDQPIHIARVWDRYCVNEGDYESFLHSTYLMISTHNVIFSSQLYVSSNF